MCNSLQRLVAWCQQTFFKQNSDPNLYISQCEAIYSSFLKCMGDLFVGSSCYFVSCYKENISLFIHIVNAEILYTHLHADNMHHIGVVSESACPSVWKQLPLAVEQS